MKGSPTPADEYTGLLRPISTKAYESLSEEEKRLYEPPTNAQAYAINLRAKELEKEAREKANPLARVVWGIFDGVNKHDYELGSVVSVTDGDTFKVQIGDRVENVRMLLVDTPETVDPNEPVQPFGPEASSYSKMRLTDKDVKIVFDGNKKDGLGRTLGYVVLTETGEDYNETLLREGLAKVRYRFDDYRNTNRYERVEREAERAREGIWSIPGYASLGDDKAFNMDAIKRFLETR
jgi:endonuclease YncB( thermonuclease family)